MTADYQSKWSILSGRADYLEKQAAEIRQALIELDRTPLKADGEPINCAGCNVALFTEADFAQHFFVPNAAYLNLGECPVRMERDGLTMIPATSPGQAIIMQVTL